MLSFPAPLASKGAYLDTENSQKSSLPEGVLQCLRNPKAHYAPEAIHSNLENCATCLSRLLSQSTPWFPAAKDTHWKNGPYYWILFPLRFTPDGKYLIVAQLNLSRLSVLVAPPSGSIGDCSVVSTIQLADQVLPHLLEVDRKTGAVYVAEIGAKQIQKYIPWYSGIPAFGA